MSTNIYKNNYFEVFLQRLKDPYPKFRQILVLFSLILQPIIQ